jgi:hypothetical protein
MLFGETVAVYCENHTEHTDTLCGQNAEFWCVKAEIKYLKLQYASTNILLAASNNTVLGEVS